MKKLNNKGVTLLEVMIYMVVSIFIIGYAFDMMKSTTRNFHHETRKADLQLNAQDIITSMGRDIAQMGFKYYLKADTTTESGTIKAITHKLEKIQGTWCTEGNFSSSTDPNINEKSAFYVIKSTPTSNSDELEFFFGSLGEDGNPNKPQAITYKLDGANLLRIKVECDTPINNTNPFSSWDFLNADTTILTKNIEALKFQFSIDYSTWINNPHTPLDIRNKINYIKVMFLIKSERLGEVAIPSQIFKMGDYTHTTTENDRYFYRLYETIIAVPNNAAN